MNKATVYVYSDNNDYMQDEYISLMAENMGDLKKGTTVSFRNFITRNEKMMQLDTETNVTEKYTERKLYVVQLGSIDKLEQHIFDIPDIKRGSNIDQLLKNLLAGQTTFLAHNAKFEYIVIYRHYEIYIQNFKDTLLGSRLITAGLDLEKGYHSLANLLELAFSIDMSKEEQTTFTGEQMSPKQLVYARHDVIYLFALYRGILKPLKRHNLETVFYLENKAIRPIGDLTINGMLVNQDALAENITLYKKNVEISKNQLLTSIKGEQKESIVAGIEALNIFQTQDEIVINWKSSKQKLAIFKLFYPDVDIKSTAKSVFTKLEKVVDYPSFITKYLNGNTEELENHLVSRKLDFLIENDMFIAKGALNLNVGSPAHMLDPFRLWYPDLASIGAKVLKKLKHPVVMAYKNLAKHQKLVSTYGEKMYSYIESDGKIHASFNQIVPSGSRMSSSKPNMQNAPSTEEFRRIYIPRPGWKMVDTDYSSMEIFLAAYMSKDVAMLKAIDNGYDMHSFSAYQIFGEKWLAAGGEAEPVGKPKTKAANAMRKQSKGASFSILYGTGVNAFSENNNMTLHEGKSVLNAYFEAFPQLVAFFKASGKEALTNNMVVEPYFKRIRFFNSPTNGMEASHNKNAGMNYKPQAANTSVLKYAVCLIKKYIEVHGLDHKVKLINMVHDETISEVREDFAAEWAIIQTDLMEQAALKAVPQGTIKAESDILDHWTKG